MQQDEKLELTPDDRGRPFLTSTHFKPLLLAFMASLSAVKNGDSPDESEAAVSLSSVTLLCPFTVYSQAQQGEDLDFAGDERGRPFLTSTDPLTASHLYVSSAYQNGSSSSSSGSSSSSSSSSSSA